MDTLKHYDELRAAGVPDAQARAQVGMVAREMETVGKALNGLATKSDLDKLEVNLEAKLEASMDAKIGVLRAEMRSDMYKILTALAVGLVFFIARALAGG